MIHVLRHLFKSAHHGVRSVRVAGHVAEPLSRATPLVWTQTGRIHKHTTSFWSKVSRWGFKFPRG